MTSADPPGPVLAMMGELYREDEPATAPDPARLPLTIATLLAEPNRGRIVLFRRGGSLAGYALVIPFWSNEFGGTLLYVDELYVVPEARGQRIASAFFAYLRTERPFDAVALALEVTPKNERARRLYESVGFTQRQHQTFTRRLAD